MTEQIENPFKAWHCVRCGHDWWSKLPLKPRYCARCKAPNWDRPKIERPQSVAGPKRDPGRPRQYPFFDLEVGQEVRIPFKEKNGAPDIAANDAVWRSVRGFEKRSGRKFRIEPASSFLRVVRLA